MARPRKFDKDTVLDQAMELFWSRGYEGTSVLDLTNALGVHPGSLYRTFGDKHGLFLQALARHRDTKARALAPQLLAGGPVLPRIRSVLLASIDAAEEGLPRGSFVINTTGGMVPHDPEASRLADEVQAITEDGFLQGLRQAARQGEVSPALDLPACATMLTMLLLSLQIMVKTNADPRRFVATVDTALASIAS